MPETTTDRKIPLYNRYRPSRWQEIVGNPIEVDSFYKATHRGEEHAYLLTGSSGIGKTSLARLGALAVGCNPEAPGAIWEHDAATSTGVDDIRRIQDACRSYAFGSKVRAFIIDECHSLSRNAWESLQKVVEEPPDHVYWFFCTTRPTKVPDTIRSRCVPIMLKALKEAEVKTIINRVCKAEGIRLPNKVDDMIAFEAGGSGRQALSYLAKVADFEDYNDAANALKKIIDTDPIREFCRFLMKRGTRRWSEATRLLTALEGENPESIRIVVCNWVGKALSNASDKDVWKMLAVLENFATPYDSAEGYAPLYLSIGRIIFSGED